MLKNKPALIYGNGEQSRDFTYIENVVNANLLALKTTSPSFGKTFNAACGTSYTILKLVDSINKLINRNIIKKFAPYRKGDIKHSWADISLAKKYLKYNPKVTLIKGLEKTIRYFKKNI